MTEQTEEFNDIREEEITGTRDPQTTGVVPEAVRHDFSKRGGRLGGVRGRGVEWVRATDLLTRGSGKVAGVGIEWTSTVVVASRRRVGAGLGRVARARRLPPVSAFGRPSRHVGVPVRAGVGLR